MMSKQTKEEVCRTLMELGRMDERKMYAYMNAKRLPGGGYGYCLASMTADTLYLTDLEGMSMELGKLLYAIPIAEMQQMKHTPRISLAPGFKFVWRGEQVALGALTTEMRKQLGV